MRTSSDDHPDAYLGTVNRIEPDVAMLDADGARASIAISLKRIADVMEKLLVVVYDEQAKEAGDGPT